MHLPCELDVPMKPRNLLLKHQQNSYILSSTPAKLRFLQSKILPRRSNCKNGKPGMTENHTNLAENWYCICKNKFQFQSHPFIPTIKYRCSCTTIIKGGCTQMCKQRTHMSVAWMATSSLQRVQYCSLAGKNIHVFGGLNSARNNHMLTNQNATEAFFENLALNVKKCLGAD